MPHPDDRSIRRILDTVHSRRRVLKSALAVSAGGVALSSVGVRSSGGVALARARLPLFAAGDEMLSSSKFTIANTLAVNLTRHFATAPLFEGTFNGQPVWYVITEASDEGMANDLGVNFAPRLANIPVDSPTVQSVTSGSSMLGQDMVTFAGVPEFGPTRELTPGPTGFPPAHFTPGAFGDAMYSDLVRVNGGNVVFNAPIMALGDGPFDVTTHADTNDRVLAIDTSAMTVDLLFVRAFAFGQDILYHSFSSSDPLAAVLERGTFIPSMAKIPITNTRTEPTGARSTIFAFVNGQTGPTSPPAQGLNHVIVDGKNAEDASFANMDVLEALRMGGDAHNVLDSFPTLSDPALAHLYTPLWDVQFVRWTEAAAERGLNVAQMDGNEIRQLAAQGLVTAPDHLPLVTQNIVVNCPVIAFIDQPPTEPQAADPGRSATLSSGAP